MRDTPSMAKNKIARSLRAILDPCPSNKAIQELWDHFSSKCAYCGSALSREKREGHLDHLTPITAGGTNDIHNHVLACGRCNGDEKRESPWREFLKFKAETPVVRRDREKLILNWSKRSKAPALTPENLEKGEAIIAAALKSFGGSVAKMRKLRGGET